MKNYKPQELSGAYLTSSNDILSEDILYSNNVIGMVPGTDPVLKNEYIVVGGHLDHVAPQQGKPSNGADDNASGSAGVIEIAGAIAQNPCKRTVVFITYTAEEMGLLGSSWFLESGLFPIDRIRFNINLDMIGRTGKENESTRAHYVVTDKKYLAGIIAFINELNTGITDFPILFDDDEHSPGGSDHMTFIGKGIPAFFFFSGVHADLHRPGDDPEKIDYPKAAAISRLSYLIARKLANMDVVPGFE
jgi:Zn-dependent M28 family amino/carboxypeptidase